ncbi:MAG: leucine-rich repeat domain-containing protein, partial [Peptococcaceae bacterium]|nr:leucine-rich repeat domain-containing protein [Peptococcaceae bacterium]
MIFHIERGILKHYTGSDTIVQIPDGVVEIGYRAFYRNQTIEQIVLPDSMVKIGLQAFAGCTVLQHIAFNQSLRFVGYDAFQDTAWHAAQPEGIVYAGP